MGKYMHGALNFYSDSSYSTLAVSINNVIFPIAVGSTTDVNMTDVHDDYDFFVDKVLPNEYLFLGEPLVVGDDRSISQDLIPSQWLPMCIIYNVNINIDSCYSEFVFDNGYKIRRRLTQSASGSILDFYDNNGQSLGTCNNAGWILRNNVLADGRCANSGIVVSALNPDGTIPDSATGAKYLATGFWGSGMWGSVDRFSTSDWSVFRDFLNAVPVYVKDTDPYTEIDPSVPGGGDGTYDFQGSDSINFPTLPSLSAVATGFVSLWSPTEQQMLDLSSFMWNADITTIDFWKKLFADPKELIFGLSLVPLNLADLGYIDGQGTVVVGLVNTRIMMDKISSQWVEFDCGSLVIDEAWGAYLDYDPYTKLEIYLPFCGVHPIKADDFIPGTISLKYYIDLLSGTCVAMIKSTKSDKHGDVLNSVMYQFMGNCAAQIPVSSQQFADAVRSAISIAASIGSMVATGVGGAAAMTAAKSGGAALTSAMRTLSSEISTGASAVENVMNIKPAIERSGAIGSTAALLGVRTPYLILTRPRMARPDKQSTYTGYPSFITETLGDISGWTIVQAIHLDAIPCTSEEMREIDELLKGGVIL